MVTDSPNSNAAPPGARSVLGLEEEAIRSQLAQTLASPEFRSSQRCQEFLRFVVEQTLAGHAGVMKERTIGTEAFGRAADYDTNLDGVVRIKASEVRKRLSLYYAGSGKAANVVIELPVGSYVPNFTARQPSSSSNGSAEGSTESAAAISGNQVTHDGAAEQPGQRSSIRIVLMAAGLIVAISLSAYWWHSQHTPSVLNEFWEPVLGGSGPVLIAAAYVPVYAHDGRVPGDQGELLLMSDQYVGGGDLVAAARVAGMLGRMGRASEVRVGNAISFQDLRNSPTVLIGYSSTQWKDVTQDFRFYVDDSDRGMIRDNGKPTEWYPHNITRDFHTDEDYAVVSRAFLPQTHSMLILISGCTQYGTEGAADLITHPELLAGALREAPAGWQHKNLQLVLRMQVIANAPASPQVVAAHFW
ncbi:conserved hypothetical protein [Candidatus Sulfotelmatobacter sp. SbA7]|nr:conserved hypothetical protein [Candidatus Sulfotelmatobacter sp. SbA7]